MNFFTESFMSVESVAAELAAMRALTRNLETQLKKLDPETQKRVLAWFAEQVRKKIG